MDDRMTAAELRAFHLGQGKICDADLSPPLKQKRRKLEEPIHLAIVELLMLALPIGAVFHHSPNELDMKGDKAARMIAKAKAMGMRPGFPDIVIFYAQRSYFIEIKAPNGNLSEDQKELRTELMVQGFNYAVCYSVDDAAQALKSWGLVKA